MTLHAHGEPPLYFTFASLTAAGLPHAVTTRHCPGVTSSARPVSPFDADAGAVLAHAGLDLSRIAYARQVHGAARARVFAGGAAGLVDILLTTEHALPLAIFTADCVAITLYDPVLPALAVAHVGWRGTVAGGARAAVAALTEIGADAARLIVTVGPSIGPCCYEVDKPVVDEFATAYGAASERWMQPVRAGHWMLDLWAATEELLESAGVSRARIENPRACTACHPELFYSYRKGNRGRLVTVAALP